VSLLTYDLARLDTGAQLITVPLDRPSVSVAIMFGVGSRNEDDDSCGLSHFIEHIVFKGAEGYPTARAISETVEGVGGAVNAGTDKEATVFYAKVPSDHAEMAVDVLSAMVFDPVLDPAEVAKERQVVVEELRMYQDSPQDHVSTLFDEVMYPGQPLGWDVAGTEEAVRRITPEAVRSHLERHYRPDAAVITVAGGIGPDQARGLVEAALPRGRERVAVAPAQPALEVRGSALRVQNKRTEQANIVLGGHACSYTDPRRHALDLLNVILGEGMSSRLFLELREERALAYDVHSYTAKLADTGYLAVYIGCEPRRAHQATTAVVDELLRLATEPVTAAELHKAREYSKGRLLLHLESTSAISQYLAQQQLLVGRIETPEEIVAAQAEVTAEEIREVAAAICAGGLRGALIGPFAKPDRFETALARAS
jgi:predicted Zn-dependent peptidase